MFISKPAQNIPDQKLTALRVSWLRIPLARPYLLSFGPVTAFDVFVTEGTFEDGSVAYGEATPLPGYSEETPASVWRDLREHALAPERAHPFARAALVGPVEWARLRARAGGAVEVPLIGTVMEHESGRVQNDVQSLLDIGYRTLKLKVGLTALEHDLAHVTDVQGVVRDWLRARQGSGDRVNLRIDANQGYDVPVARRFLKEIDPEFIELFEQPFPVEHWQWYDEIGPSPISLMLDESIVDEADVERASTLQDVRFVKFKLMKAGGFDALELLVAKARSCGLDVILGNGVAADVGCATEALAAAALGITFAGEMNGFLKTRHRLSADSLAVQAGVLRCANHMRIDLDNVDAEHVDSALLLRL